MKRMQQCRLLLVSLAICFSCLPIHAQDSIIIHKTNTSTKHNINLYTNASQKVLFFNARGQEGSVYHLLLFRKGGTLIKQTKILSRETAVVAKPEKGDYYFEVFTGDNRIETGTIIVQ